MTDIVYNKNGVAFDIDALATDVNGKMDRDGLNSLASVCVESYVNGTSGYRVYSDGYCVQWGRGSGTLSGSLFYINLLKPYKDANFNFSVQVRTNGNDTGSFFARQIDSQDVFDKIHYFLFLNNGITSYNPNVTWSAWGYIS